jgi:hypothetical protein
MTETMNGKGRPTKVAPMPEFLSRKDHAGTAWTIQESSAARGEPSTNIKQAKMRVPMGTDETSRVIRAHEMVHAKVSPLEVPGDDRFGATPESLIVAEEFRVNTLVQRAGFNTDELMDGSETKSGEIYGKNNEWNGAIRTLTAYAGGKAASSFLRGVKKTNPEMEASLREFQKLLKKQMKSLAKHRKFSDTTPVVKQDAAGRELSYPAGFESSIRLARFVDSYLISEGGDADDGRPQDIPDPEEIKETSGSRGKFARLVLKDLPKPKKVTGNLGRKRLATDIGRNPRRINRMLTDPERRVFDKWSKASGGVVVIDQSGSMSLTHNDIMSIIESAPGCLIIGYSHQPGSDGHPNAWVLADRGNVVANMRDVPNNSGNGVDGPVLRYAINRRKKHEPLVWVCDGMVTDGANDCNYANLSIECVKLVKDHGIHMVGDVEDAVKALKKAANGTKLHATLIGSLKPYSRRLA